MDVDRLADLVLRGGARQVRLAALAELERSGADPGAEARILEVIDRLARGTDRDDTELQTAVLRAANRIRVGALRPGRRPCRNAGGSTGTAVDGGGLREALAAVSAEYDRRRRAALTFDQRYEILEALPAGGMARVVRAWDRLEERAVALKTPVPQLLEQRPESLELFRAEGEILKTFEHPNIVRVHDVVVSDRGWYIVMEYIPGPSLAEMIDQRSTSYETILKVVPPICEALRYAHGRGIIHCDLKPDNILLQPVARSDESGPALVSKLVDFGIALARIGGSRRAQPDCPGTDYYMAPEQLLEPALVGPPADIHALGVVIYETLTGTYPTGNWQPASRVRPGVPPAVDRVISRCLEQDQRRRFQTAVELQQAIEGLPRV